MVTNCIFFQIKFYFVQVRFSKEIAHIVVDVSVFGQICSTLDVIPEVTNILIVVSIIFVCV